MLHGQALVPVHALTKYGRGRIIRDEQRRQAERARDIRQAESGKRQARARRNPLSEPQRRRRKPRRSRRHGAQSVDSSEVTSSSVSSMALLLEELESQRVHETEKGGTIGQSSSEFHGMPEPSEEGALRLMASSLKKARSIDPKEAMRQYRYPWRECAATSSPAPVTVVAAVHCSSLIISSWRRLTARVGFIRLYRYALSDSRRWRCFTSGTGRAHR